MHYKESKKILEKIRESKRILINCHSGPDPDAVGSALYLYMVLKKMGKEVEMVCPDDLPHALKFLPHSKKIKRIDFENFDFSSFDLFIILDCSGWDLVLGDKKEFSPGIFTVVIDHHKSNEMFGDLNLVDKNIGSCAELLYLIFEDWGVKLDEEIASSLLAGIIGDTGVFRHSGASSETLKIASKLMELGADKDQIVLKIYGDLELNLLKFWGEILKKMKIDKTSRFVWAAIPYEDYKKFNSPEDAKSTTASMFFRSVKDTDFGIVMIEEREGRLSLSLRARRKGVDVSKLAEKFGGGGHERASGAVIKDLDFKEAVKKVLRVAREFANESKEKN